MEPDTILVAIGDEDAGRIATIVRTVRKIADPADARVVVAHVVPEAEYEQAVDQVSARSGSDVPFSVTPIGATAGSPSGAPADRELSESEVFEAIVNQRSVVKDTVGALADAGVDHEVRGGVGDPADRVVALAEDLDADFVVVGGRDRSPTQQALFGSVSQDIIRSVAAPVITVRGA